MTHGPLAGVRVLEFAGIGPGPFCAMLLADAGAEVVRIVRPGAAGQGPPDPLLRGRPVLELDLKSPEAVRTCLAAIRGADALLEGARPGVMERLGLGPEEALAANSRLVYGRMTGWGQSGPLSQAAGHDINYLALSGALHAIGPAERPVPPLNLAADFGGGALYLAFGMMAALVHVRGGGEGQVVDAAMTDGAASLMTMFYGFLGAGRWRDRRESNLLDGGAPFYAVYACADGRFLSVGALEPQFYTLLLDKLGVAGDPAFDRDDPRRWPELRARFAALFATRSRDDWCALLEGADACVAPVLSLTEAPEHPHNLSRGTFGTHDGLRQPAPAPRFSATPGAVREAAVLPDAREVLRGWGAAV